MRARGGMRVTDLAVRYELNLQLVEDGGDVGEVVGLAPAHSEEAGLAQVGLLVSPGRQTGGLDVVCKVGLSSGPPLENLSPVYSVTEPEGRRTKDTSLAMLSMS